MSPCLRTAAALLCGVAAAAVAAPDGPSAMAEVERAHYLQGTVGDLPGAIAAYAAVADDPANPRRWRAEATFGLASCHDLQGSYLTANRYYLKVVKEFGDFGGLADRAAGEIVAVSRALAEGGGAVSDDDYFYLCDLALVLDAAAENDELELAGEVAAELRALLGRLAAQVEGTPDESAFDDMAGELRGVELAISAGDAGRVRSLLRKAEELGTFIDAVYGSDPGEVFNPALRWKDRAARALATGDGARASKYYRRIAEYLAPVEETPDEDERAYARALAGQARQIAGLIEEGDLPGARRALFEGDRERAASTEVVAVYLEGFEGMPSKLLPVVSALFGWMDEADAQLDSDLDAARVALQRALALASRLGEGAAGTAFRDDAAELLADLQEALQALDDGRLEDVRDRIENEG